MSKREEKMEKWILKLVKELYVSFSIINSYDKVSGSKTTICNDDVTSRFSER
jgi:hypothetical protein